MIRLPIGFDYVQLMHDFFTFATPFVVIIFMFSVAFIIKKAFKAAV